MVTDVLTVLAAISTATAFVSVLYGLATLPLPVLSLPAFASTKSDESGAIVGVIGPGWPHRVQAGPGTRPARAIAPTTAKKRRAHQPLCIAPPLCRSAPWNLGESLRALLKR